MSEERQPGLAAEQRQQARIDELEREAAELRRQLSMPKVSVPASVEALMARLLSDGSVLANLPDIVAILDRQYQILYLNRTVRGRTVAEMIGRSLLDFLQPEDAPRYGEAFERAWASGEPQSITVRTVRDFHYEARLVPVQESDRVVFMLSTTIDVTDRARAERALRESEGRLRQAIEASGMGTWVWDVRRDSVTWDETLCRIFDVRPDEAPSDFQGFLSRVHLDDRDMVTRAIAPNRDGWVYEDFEHRIVRPDGQIRHLLTRGSTLLDENGKPVGLRACVFDITIRKRLEAQLHQAQKMEAVGQLTAGIAHNFNNALSVIIHNAALCRDRADAETAEQLAEIEYAGKRAAEMVRHLMIFARSDSHARKGAIDLARSARRTLEMCRRTMGPHIVLELEAAADLPPVRANAGQIEQVLLNICLNARDALEHAKTAAPRVQIGVDACAPDRVRVRITDNGPGMSEEVRSHLFEPFFTTKEVGRGTGLGLAMAYSIIADHQGRIECTTRPGQGTLFEITLPTAEPADLIALGAEAAPSPGGSETSGEAVLDQLAEADVGVPVVLLSGHPPPGAGAGAGVAGARAAAVLTKPIDRPTLLRAVREVLDRR